MGPSARSVRRDRGQSMADKVSLSYPYADNFNEIMGLQSRLQRTILDLENHSRQLQEMISALDQEMIRLQQLYGNYQYLYVYRYLFMLRAQLHRFRNNPRYRKDAFNVFHYLMDKLQRLSEDYANGLLQYGASPEDIQVRLREFQTHHETRPPERLLPQAQARTESPTTSPRKLALSAKSKKKQRYLYVQIQGLHLLIPYVHYRRISLPTDLMPRSKKVSFLVHNTHYPVVPVLSHDFDVNYLPQSRAKAKRGNYVLIDTLYVHFALAYERLPSRFLDIGSYVRHRLQPSPLLLWQGRVVLRDRGYWVLSPKGVRQWLADS